jgi:hypothetical protein
LPLVAVVLAMRAVGAPAATPDFAPGFVSVAHTGLAEDESARIDLWRLDRMRRHGGPVDLIMALAPRRAARVHFVRVALRGASRGLYEHVACQGALAMINGSFFEGWGPTQHMQGLLRLSGRTLQPASDRQQGGFLTTDGASLGVIPRTEAARAEAARNAIESSPILILNGRNGMQRDDGVHADRVAAGITSKGDVILIGAFGARNDAVSLYEFEALAEAAIAADHLKLKDLIAMDGGPSAHLYLPHAGLFYGQTGPIFLTDAICLGVE